jgi:hypothetical protein
VFKIAQTVFVQLGYPAAIMEKPAFPITVEEAIEMWQRQADKPKPKHNRRWTDDLIALPPLQAPREAKSEFDS